MIPIFLSWNTSKNFFPKKEATKYLSSLKKLKGWKQVNWKGRCTLPRLTYSVGSNSDPIMDILQPIIAKLESNYSCRSSNLIKVVKFDTEQDLIDFVKKLSLVQN